MKSRPRQRAYEPRQLAMSVCRDILAAAGETMKWLPVRSLEDRLGIDRSEIAPALNYAISQRWLIVESEVAQRVALREAGLKIARYQMRKAARAMASHAA